MAITNGYASLTEYKNYSIPDNAADATDDSVLEDIITAASRFIDQQTGRTFYARTETRSYDVPYGSRTLKLDDDLLTVTTFSNGNGDEITSSNYILLPANVSPKYAIRLTATSTVGWVTDSNNNSEQAIDVAGTWGFSASTPADINIACLEISAAEAGRRLGKAFEMSSTITGAGVVMTPRGVPSSAMKTLMGYRRMS